MTADEVVKKWLNHLVGLGLCGYASEQQDGPATRASKIIDLPKDCEKWLRRIHDDSQPQKDKPNGPAAK